MTYHLEDSVRWLLDRELVDNAAIVGGDLAVTSAARRNLSLRVERRHGPSYVVKQPSPGAAGAEDSLAREARFYAFCAEEPAAAAVARMMPRLQAALEPGVLVLDLLENVQTLWQAYGDRSPFDLALSVPLALGWALGTLHSTFRGSHLATDRRLGILDHDCLPCFDLHRPTPGMLSDTSRAGLELCRAIQDETGLREGLAAARAAWRCETLIHGDIRPDNVLLEAQEGAPMVPATGLPPIWLVDWEFVQRGDPAWDLGCALHDHLMFWLRSMSLRPDFDSDQRVASARFPLEPLQAAMRVLWTGYLSTASVADSEMGALLARAAHFSGVRLLQTAWEKARHLEHQSALGVLVLQLSANLMADPGRAVTELYAFDPQVPTAGAES